VPTFKSSNNKSGVPLNPLKKVDKKTLKEDIDLSVMKSSIKVKLLTAIVYSY
jgi:hypothetical protein